MLNKFVFASVFAVMSWSAVSVAAECSSPRKASISVNNLDFLLSQGDSVSLCLETSVHQMSVSDIAFLSTRHPGKITLMVTDESVSVNNLSFLIGKGVKVIISAQ